MSKLIHDLSGLLGLISGRAYQLRKLIENGEDFSKRKEALEKLEKLSNEIERAVEFLNKEKGNSNE